MKILNKILKNKLKILVLLIFIWQWSCPGLALANDVAKPESAEELEMPETATPEPLVVEKRTVAITAYSSTVDQCDDTPCITANGFDLCENNTENVVAANFLPFGTKIRIPEYFGDRVFTVQDRMNARYYYRVDVWMKSRADAIKFGLRNLTIEIIE